MSCFTLERSARQAPTLITSIRRLYSVARRVDAALVEEALVHVVNHHDALRLRIERGAAAWSVRCDEPTARIVFEVRDLSDGRPK